MSPTDSAEPYTWCPALLSSSAGTKGYGPLIRLAMFSAHSLCVSGRNRCLANITQGGSYSGTWAAAPGSLTHRAWPEGLSERTLGLCSFTFSDSQKEGHHWVQPHSSCQVHSFPVAQHSQALPPPGPTRPQVLALTPALDLLQTSSLKASGSALDFGGPGQSFPHPHQLSFLQLNSVLALVYELDCFFSKIRINPRWYV